MRGGVVPNAYRDIYDINFYWIYWRNDRRLVEGSCFVCVFGFIMLWKMHIYIDG